MTKEALKLALEALEQYAEYEGETRAANEAITAIKEALAQPEQEPVGKFAKFTDGIWREVTDGSAGVPLYTTPPQRTWVGLTDEEVITMSRYDLEYAALIGEVQRRLKEKNT